ncbi:MAG: hypothetical protein JNM68_12040 [Dinghuibacter sp.]|nr:hypothetical protein [Dinghuibacter sp.]
MKKKRTIELVGRKVSFAEAEELDIEYYAQCDWKQSATTAEHLRQMVWGKVYGNKMEKTGRITALKDDRDDFE